MPSLIFPHEITFDEVVPKGSFIFPHEQVDPPTPQDEALSELSSVQRAMVGAGAGFNDKLIGAKQSAGILRNILPGDPSTWPQEGAKELQEISGERKTVFKDPMARLGYLTSDLISGLLAFGASGGTMLGGVVAGGALGAMQPQEEPNFQDMMINAGKGSLYGGGANVAFNSLANQVARLKNMRLNKFSDPEAANRYRIFKAYDVPGSLGDITQNPIIQGFENIVQSIPASGRHGFLEEQAKRLGKVVSESPETVAGSVPSGTKERLGEVIAQSLKDKYQGFKSQAKGLYDQVANLVQSSGNPPINPQLTASAVNKLLQNYPSVFSKLNDDVSTVKALQDISQGTGPQASVILGANGTPILKPPQVSFDDIRELDKNLGSLIRQGKALTAKGELNNQAFGQLVEVQKALRKDVSNWANSIGNPQIASGINYANDYFRTNILPFRKNPVIRRVIQDGEYNPDNLPKALFGRDQPFKSTQALHFLTPEGVQAGRYYLVNEAKKGAMNDMASTGFNPNKFIRELNMGETGPKLYSPNELATMDDLSELVHSSRRAASYNADPSNASRWALMSPLFGPKLPLTARLFSTLGHNDSALRYMLSSPRFYTGSGKGVSGGLARATEEILRGVPAGLGGGFKDIQYDDR